MKINYIFSILFILLALPVFSQKNQTRIYGKVSTAEKALSGIIISLENTSFSTETGSESTFSFNAPAGTYKLICSGIGYQTQTLKITLKENTSKKINITLTPDTVTNSNVEALDNVEIRGKSFKRKLES